MKLTLQLSCLLVACFAMSACATYRFGHYKRNLPGGYDRIAIPVFQNKTDEVGIETYFTRSLRTEFERSGLAHVTSKSDAQVILEGTIVGLSISGTDGTQYGDSGLQTPNPRTDPDLLSNKNPLAKGTTLNRTLNSNITVRITARKVSDNGILWESDFNSSRNFYAALIGTPDLTYANPLYNQNAKVITIEKQAQDMMSEAHDRLTENF